MERLLRACFKERVDNKKIQCYISTRTNRIHNERVKIMVTKTDYYDVLQRMLLHKTKKTLSG